MAQPSGNLTTCAGSAATLRPPGGRKRAAMQAPPSSESTTIEYARPVVESTRPIYSTEEDDLNIPAFLRRRT